jgi:NAD(P)-dependent dehydrogenase (short-subunit alcohol dehydrogenase family)
MIEIDLTGKVALVSGGSRGIGASISKCLAKAGAEVWINHRPTSESTEKAKTLVNKISQFGGIAREIGADLTCEDDVKAMVDTIIDESKKIDILVCSAGSTIARPLAKLSSEEWESIQKLNLTHVFYLTKRVVPLMAASGGGNIVLIGSAGVRYGGGGGVHYASSKSALTGFMLALSREYISKKIRVNIIHPSLVDTELLRERYSTKESREKLAKRVPLGRLSRPDDIGYLTTFLVSGLASYITCQEIFVDGAMTIPF